MHVQSDTTKDGISNTIVAVRIAVYCFIYFTYLPDTNGYDGYGY